jgi:acyl-coenzyme A synthetase/AMP-(fatty) acid ligase
MFDSYIAFQARSRPAAPAIVTLLGVRSFEEFDADIDRAVVELGRLSVEPGEPVSVAFASAYMDWVVTLALARLGVATAPANDVGSRIRVGDGSTAFPAPNLLLDEEAHRRILRGPRPFVRAIRRPGSELARVLQSSGTTGERKRLGMSWDVIDAAIRNALIAYGAPAGPWLASTGIGTILGMVVTLAGWASGNPAVLGLGGTLPPQKLQQLKPRLIALVPDQLRRLLDELPAEYQRWPVRVVSGGGSVPPNLARRTEEQLTGDLRSVYGASETGAVAIAELPLLKQQASAAGYVLPLVDVEIVDEHGEALAAGELGRVRIRSNRVASHYLDDEQRSLRVFRDGWFHSGDLGRLRVDGLLLIEGREDELMNIGGHKVLPDWIEQAALLCTGVTDAAAFSRPDDDGLERCWLAIVHGPTSCRTGCPRRCELSLGGLERIEVIFQDQIPRNGMGKIERNRLRNLAQARGAQA